MIYSITVKLPKSKIQQYDMPGPVSVNDLSDSEFTDLLGSFASHVRLSKELSKLKSGLKQIFWETLSPQKLNLFINFYSSDPQYFADYNTAPGENGTVNHQLGESVLRNNNVPNLINSNQAYTALGVNPLPYARYNKKNYFIPNYEINPLYKVDIQDPDPATFDLILNELIEKNILPAPLGEKKYRTKPKLYQYNNVWYKLPDYNTLKKNDDLLQIFKKYVSVESVKLFTENINAWISFLGTLPEQAHNADDYDTYKSIYLNKIYTSVPGNQGKKVPVFEYDNELYYVPSYETFNKFKELKDLWTDIIVLNRPIKNSRADEALRQLKAEYPFQELNDLGLTFKTFFNIKLDPRWKDFVNKKYYKIPENATTEQIKKIKEEIRIRSPRLFLFSSIKSIAKIKVQDGRKKYCFNLSNTYFEEIPDGAWKTCMLLDDEHKDKIYEFSIWCETAENNQCVLWKGESKTPNERGDITTTPFTFEHNKGMDENAYSIDAVLVNEKDEIQYIVEFDGTQHYYGSFDNSPTSKIVSDQVKNRFAREINKDSKGNYIPIPCIRIPGFRNAREYDFQNDFKKYVINLIRNYYNLPSLQQEQESETTNPAIKEITAYKIRQIIK